MARVEDAALVTALESQLRELGDVLAQLETVQSTLVPPPASFWRGAAARIYELERSNLATALAEGIATVNDALSSTGLAVQQVMARV